MNSPTLFDQASRVFDGWTDPDTGMRVLRIFPKNFPRKPGFWSTFYHQYNCFLDGGRTVVLCGETGVPFDHLTYAVDLTTGEAREIAPLGMRIVDVSDKTRIVALRDKQWFQCRVSLWDLESKRELAGLDVPDGWHCGSINLLSDGQRALVFHRRGKPYEERVDSRHYLLTPGEPPRLVMEAEGCFCSHIQSCPADPNLYTYDRWASPPRNMDQAITIRSLTDGTEEPVKLDAHAMRPPDMWGCRDHYVWTPDSKRIVSYLCGHPITHESLLKGFNHFEFEWWLSALDWRTGADLCAKYPPGRWGGHMQVTPDSRYIICGGGPGFDKLFAIDIESLRNGWNEHIICSYPKTISRGSNSDPFPHPWVLPETSGVLFNAGWPGETHSVYLAEWPQSLK